MRILICEDEKYWVASIEKSLHQWALLRAVDIKCDHFYSSKDLIHYLSINKEVDVLLLDISLGNEAIDGVTTAKYIRKMGIEIPIIFITVDSTRAADGYLVEAMGFLGKPIDMKRLILFMDKITRKKNREHDKNFKITTENSVITVAPRDMLFIEVNNHTIMYHTANGSISLRGTLRSVLELLGENEFVQIHRSYIIAKGKIHSIKSTYPYSVKIIAISEVIELPVSRKYIEKLLEVYSDDFLEKMI